MTGPSAYNAYMWWCQFICPGDFVTLVTTKGNQLTIIIDMSGYLIDVQHTFLFASIARTVCRR